MLTISTQLLKCIHNLPEGITSSEARRIEGDESVLLRAYGRDTSILIDRERWSPSSGMHPAFNH